MWVMLALALGSPQQEDDPPIARLTSRVKGDDPGVRQRAEAEIVRLGKAVIPALEKAIKETDHRIKKERLARVLRAIAISEVIGQERVWGFLEAPEGLARLDFLLRERRDLRLDRAGGLLLADEIVGGIEWSPVYDPWHRGDTWKVWDRVVTGRWTAMGWLYVRLLYRDNQFERQHALSALGELEFVEAAPDVARLLHHKEPADRSFALGTLAKLHARKFKGDVIKLLEDQEAGVRRCAARALAEMLDAEAISDLVPRLSDPDYRVRAEAAMAFETIGSRDAREDLRKALEKEDPRGRTARRWIEFAIQSLDRIKVSRDPVRILGTYSGLDSRVDRQESKRVASRHEWARLWAQHAEGRAPEVDFDRCMVVAVFLGRTGTSLGLTAVRAAEDYEEVVLRLDDGSFQQMGEPPPPRTPFAFFVLPASSKPVVLEMPVRESLDEPALWRERARLAPK
jgi:hypothetical protein